MLAIVTNTMEPIIVSSASCNVLVRILSSMILCVEYIGGCALNFWTASDDEVLSQWKNGIKTVQLLLSLQDHALNCPGGWQSFPSITDIRTVHFCNCVISYFCNVTSTELSIWLYQTVNLDCHHTHEYSIGQTPCTQRICNSGKFTDLVPGWWCLRSIDSHHWIEVGQGLSLIHI